MKITKALDRLAKMHSAEITFGIHEEQGASAHTDSGLTVAEIGARHEFGEGVPRRSWLEDFTKDKATQIEALKATVVGQIFDGLNPAVGYERFALGLEGAMKTRFNEGIGPALSPVTIARKGSSLQLVDEGILRASIRAKVK